METSVRVGLILGAYFLGAVPFGLLIAKYFARVDVRKAGSGNIGATNVARSAGKGLGVVTLLLDGIKGAVPPLLAQFVFEQPIIVTVLAGFAAVLGHVLPIYLWFRGGKGVATSLGVFAVVSPIPTLLAAGGFAVIYALARIVSLGSLIGALILVIATVFWDRRPEVIGLAVGLFVLVLVRHAGNIRRLLSRSENKV